MNPTGSTSARTSWTRALLIGTVLVAFAVIGGIAVIGITLSPADDGGTSDMAGVTVPQGASPEPVASARANTTAPSLAPSATPVGNRLTITGALTILSSGTEPQAEAGADLSTREPRPEAPWTPVKAELDALIARRDSGELDPGEFLDAYEDIGCVGQGEFSEFAPGRPVRILDERGLVIAKGALQVGSLAGPDAPSGCRLPFTIVGVPPASVYAIAVGGATLRYTREQLDARGWDIELEFGASS
jgi:hypothetical protein